MSNWSTATYIWVSVAMIANLLFSIWVTIGGWFDLRAMFRDLRKEQVDTTDDGRVE